MLLFSRTRFADFSKRPWFAKTLYDLPENLDRLKELLPISLRKGFDTCIPDLKLRRMNRTSTLRKSRIFPNRPTVWDSREDCLSSNVSITSVREMLTRPSYTKMVKPELTLRRPSFKRPL